MKKAPLSAQGSGAFCVGSEYALSAKSTAGNFATPETTPSVIACGDATFPKGTALAVAGNFAAAPKGAPLGELAANVVSRLRGFCCKSDKKTNISTHLCK